MNCESYTWIKDKPHGSPASLNNLLKLANSNQLLHMIIKKHVSGQLSVQISMQNKQSKQGIYQ